MSVKVRYEVAIRDVTVAGGPPSFAILDDRPNQVTAPTTLRRTDGTGAVISQTVVQTCHYNYSSTPASQSSLASTSHSAQDPIWKTIHGVGQQLESFDGLSYQTLTKGNGATLHVGAGTLGDAQHLNDGDLDSAATFTVNHAQTASKGLGLDWLFGGWYQFAPVYLHWAFDNPVSLQHAALDFHADLQPPGARPAQPLLRRLDGCLVGANLRRVRASRQP